MTAKNDYSKLEKTKVLPQTFSYLSWEFSTMKTHILQSKCNSPEMCKDSSATGDGSILCTLCRYNATLSLPSLPDMVFGDNFLKVSHKNGFGLEFTTLDALKLVDDKHDVMKVAVADAWNEVRADSEHIREVINPFDWTFTTNYKGTVIDADSQMKVVPTTETINIEKLKQREKILFYDDVHLFDDELADNGCASCSVKLRVMPSGFFVLLRFYLRVDNVLIRINDTRLHHEFDKPYILREYSSRESPVNTLKVPASVYTDPNEIWPHLAVKEELIEKLEFSL